MASQRPAPATRIDPRGRWWGGRTDAAQPHSTQRAQMMSSLHSTGIGAVSITRQRWLSSATRAFDGGQAAHSGSGWRAGGVAGRAGCWGRAAVRADRHRKLLGELRRGLAARASSTSARVRGRSMPANSGQDRAHAPADRCTCSYHPRRTSATRGWAGNSGCCRSCAEWRVRGHRLRLLLGHPRSASRCSCSRV